MKTINYFLDHWTRQQPDKLLFAFLEARGAVTESYTYQQFQDRVNAIAEKLYAMPELHKGDRVLLVYPPGLEIICAFFACAKIGLIPVPVAPPSENNFYAILKKMNHSLEDCGAVAILSDRKYHWFFQLNLAKQRLLDPNITMKFQNKIPWIFTEYYKVKVKDTMPENPAEFLFLQYTSGSTNAPKGVMVSHENVLHNAENSLHHCPVAVSWLPQFHDMGLLGYYLFILIKGGTTYGFSPMDFLRNPLLWLETISKYKATTSSAPNFAFEYCLREDKISSKTLKNSALNLNSLKILMTAAEPVRATTFTQFFNRFQPSGLSINAFSAAYGLAENTIAVAMNGRTILSLNRNLLLQNKLKIMPSQTNQTTQMVSCGKPLAGVQIKIVNPENCCELPSNKIGEIWVSGNSKCLGYWNKKDLTEQAFGAAIKGICSNTFLRTGDLGFFHQNELYICGRIKDLIIIRGENYYPQDIEMVVEESSPEIRKGAVVCAGLEIEKEERLAIFIEVKNPEKLPEIDTIAQAVRKYCNLQAHQITLLAPHSIPKTTSGKLARSLCKQKWLENKLPVLDSFFLQPAAAEKGGSTMEDLKSAFKLKDKENCSLSEAGLDSLEMVALISEIKKLLTHRGAKDLAESMDIRIFHRLTVADLFDFMEKMELAPQTAIDFFGDQIVAFKKEQLAYEKAQMQQDRQLSLPAISMEKLPDQARGNIMLTGGTGFLGPFLLHSLLQQTKSDIYVLVRASNSDHAKKRLKNALAKSGLFSWSIQIDFERRVKAFVGDLSQDRLALSDEMWKALAQKIDTIYHNGAAVNYISAYEDLRAVNVLGTQQMLQLAMAHHAKIFHHISTTFIFGWSTKSVLYESDNNDEMAALDFGYAQSKWVSEQLVLCAYKKGLKGCLFRPSLVAPSTTGGGYHFDIAMRLFAFIINHGISATAKNQMSLTPVDIVANNIISISKLEDAIGKTFHIAADEYYNIGDITHIISELRNQKLDYFELRGFMKELKKRATTEDLIYPLLDFFTRSTDQISAMEFKRYDTNNYKKARAATPKGMPDVSLWETVEGIVQFLEKENAIEELMALQKQEA